MIPTVMPMRRRPMDRCMATVDLPAPPFSLPTTMVCARRRAARRFRNPNVALEAVITAVATIGIYHALIGSDRRVGGAGQRGQLDAQGVHMVASSDASSRCLRPDRHMAGGRHTLPACCPARGSDRGSAPSSTVWNRSVGDSRNGARRSAPQKRRAMPSSDADAMSDMSMTGMNSSG